MDVFIEHMIRRAKSGSDRVKEALLIAGCILLSGVIAFISLHTGAFMMMVWVLAVAAVWYFGIRLIRRLRIEYEYVFTNGELDVDVIYAKSMRRNLVSVRAADISCLARIDDARYAARYKEIPEHLQLLTAVSNTRGAKLYFADFLYNAERTRLIFEPNMRLLEAMKKYNAKCVHLPEEEM